MASADDEPDFSETRAQPCQIKLDVFEGPLDLLLHLVKKHELPILDIPISFITERYLAYLDLMKRLNLDIAAEYLVMAATLAHIKSRLLLPQQAATGDPDEPDDEADPRAELVRRLLEYQKYKDAAEKLSQRPVAGRDIFFRGAAPPVAIAGDAPLADVPIFELLEALDRVMKKAKITLSHEVVVERISIVDRINGIVDRLELEPELSFESLLLAEDTGSLAQLKHLIVITFLAILEMAKLRMVKLKQNAAGETILVSKAHADIVAAKALLAQSPKGE
jgi:segregation and condensation protein A